MKKTMVSVAAAALVLAAGSAAPASAASPSAGATPADVQVTRAAPSQYIEAASPQDAAKKFEALDEGGATARAASVRYGPCTLYPSVMYLRKSSNYGAVGAKPYTRCSVPVSSIRHSTDLRYKSFIWWRKATTKTGGNSGVASYTQRNVEYYCVSKESTGWSGTTAGTISYGGKNYYARVYQPVKTLACGG